MSINITSSAFKHGDLIPVKYTCDGDNISPPLTWNMVPDSTKSLALINDDPDAPMGIWVHWVMYNLPPQANQLEENIPTIENLKNGAVQGINDFKNIGYGGPCPPGGTHRYFFTLYALDTILDYITKATKSQLLKAMEDHILDKGELMGKYSR